MVKLTETYKDYNGVERTEDFYFELNEAEVLEMQAEENGQLGNLIQKIIDEKDSNKLMQIFKRLVLASYGEKSLDGRYFEKSEEITRHFTQTKAYPQIFMRLAINSKAASEFVNGILPEGMGDKINELRSGNEDTISEVTRTIG